LEVSGEILRYVSELDDSEESEKSIDYVYIVRRVGGDIKREQISKQSLIDPNFDLGEILSFVIGFR
jgi:hypothetical protein